MPASSARYAPRRVFSWRVCAVRAIQDERRVVYAAVVTCVCVALRSEQDPPIAVIDNFLTPEECQTLIDVRGLKCTVLEHVDGRGADNTNAGWGRETRD